MQTQRMRFVQIRPRSPWQWLLVIPLMAIALVMAFLFVLVAAVATLFTGLFPRKRRPVSEPPSQPGPGAGRIIDAEYVIDEDD